MNIESILHAWMNVATIMCLVGLVVWLTLLPHTTFFEDDD